VARIAGRADSYLKVAGLTHWVAHCRLRVDSVEKVCCVGTLSLIHSSHRSGREDDDGCSASRAECFVLRVLGRETSAGRPYAASDRPLRRSWRGSATPCTFLQHDWTTVGRPRAADPHADHRLLLRHPLGTPAVRGGPSEPGLPMGSVGSAWRARCQIIRPSRRTAMAACATAIFCATCSRRWCAAAWPRAWWAATGWRSTAA
jgi:hypothetical protein